MTGTRPVGRGRGSEVKYPADALYDQRSLTICAVLALAPKIPPASSLTPEPVSRPKKPPLSETVVPGASRGDLVMMFTTPVSAFAPQTADAGPRTTSICLMSPKLVGRKSHRTSPKKSRYTDRPSISTSCELERVDVLCRLVRLKSRADVWIAFMPGTDRSRSA